MATDYRISQLIGYIGKKGFSPESLIFRPNPTPLRVLKKKVKKAIGKEEHFRESEMSAERLDAFDSFNRYISLKTIGDTSTATLNSYRYFSTGSDQIWGMMDKARGEQWGFLQFARPEQRIALAPSFGVDSLNESQMKRLATYMQGYRLLSVREESGAKFIKEASGRNAHVICDPTLALHAAEWRSVSNDRLTPNGGYVLAYLLGDYSEEAENALHVASCYGELPVIRLSDREREGEPPAGPAEFISLVNNASWVVTDSFHGSVFSVIFQRPLTIVHRDGGHAMYSKMFGRLETLAGKLGIKHKVYGSQDFDLSRSADYEGVSEAIEHERSKFMEYLEACLSA